MMHDNGTVWPAVLGVLGWIGLIAVLVMIGVVLGRGRDGPALPAHRSETPLDVLEQRFARGEIERDEFDEARARIREDGDLH